MARILIAFVLFFVTGLVVAEEKVWYCNETTGVGLIFKDGQYEVTRLLEDRFTLKQDGDSLLLPASGASGKFAWFASSARCKSIDVRPHIIRCSTDFNIFLLNTQTGNATYGKIAGWTLNEHRVSSYADAMGVWAIQCEEF